MDIEEFIKIEEQPCFNYQNDECQPFGYNIYAEFYDPDSNQQQQPTGLSIDEILQIIQDREGFLDTPVEQLISDATIEFDLDPIQLQYFRRRIKKQKNIMKRNRAKGRRYYGEKYVPIVKMPILKEQSQVSRESTQNQKQIKKQRNRISAQISRDRKKNYVSSLQQKNKELSSEAQILKKQNEKLKKQIQQKCNSSKSPFLRNLQQNKFVKLLIMLGLVLFLYILGDAFKASGQEVEQRIQTQISQKKTVTNGKFMSLAYISQEEEKECFQILSEEDYGDGSIKDRVISAVTQMRRKTQNVFLPRSIEQKINEVTSKFVS